MAPAVFAEKAVKAFFPAVDLSTIHIVRRYKGTNVNSCIRAGLITHSRTGCRVEIEVSKSCTIDLDIPCIGGMFAVAGKIIIIEEAKLG